MKILFKNNTKYTKDRYNDFIEFHKNKFGLKTILKALIILICAIYILIFNIISKNWLVILSVAVICLILYMVNNFKLTKEKSNNNKMYKKQNEFAFFFYEKYIKIKCGRKFERLKYFELHRIFETKDYFFLYTDETHSLILDKNGFEIGTARGFQKFIKRKCPLKYKLEKEKSI